MISAIIRVKDAYINSSNVSLQQEHLELFIQGKLFSVVLADTKNNVLQEFKGPDLSRLIASAINNGKRIANTSHGTDYYYLGDRS